VEDHDGDGAGYADSNKRSNAVAGDMWICPDPPRSFDEQAERLWAYWEIQASYLRESSR
jgi:hypothetical protein